MRFFSETTRFVRLIFNAIYGIRYFACVQILFMFAFGFAVYFINADFINQNEAASADDKQDDVIYPHIGYPLIDSLLN